MVFELRRSVKLGAAFPAAELSVLVVPPYVVLQVPLCDKLLRADLTLVVAVAEMRLEVDVEVPFLCEFVAAELALVGLDSQVLADVDLQPRLLAVAHVADGALEGLHLCVVELVGLHVPLG
jgi:hypothetical protein